MAISIDDVYQKVLAIANKEQRGYITPQEFNLFANKAQKEIFDSYFHDFKTAYHKPTKTDMTHGDEMDILSEKIQPFKTTSTSTPSATNGIYTSLKDYLFNLFSILEYISIPSSVLNHEANAEYGCSSNGIVINFLSLEPHLKVR